MTTDTDAPTSNVSLEWAALNALVKRTERRLAIASGLTMAGRALPFLAGFLVALAALYRLQVFALSVLSSALLLAIVVFALLVVRKISRASSPLRAALLLDRRFDLQGRLSTAWEWGRGNVGEDPGGFARIVESELAQRGPFASQRAVPLSVPSGLLWGFSLLLCSLLVLALPFPRTPAPETESSKTDVSRDEEAWMSEDDAELLRRSAQELEEQVATEDGRDAASRFNEIVLKVVSGEISQQEAFQLAAELQADLNGTAGDAEQLREGLIRRGASLSAREVTRDAGTALTEQRFEDAAEALRRLSERLSDEREGLSQEELEELRESLDQARKQVEETENTASESDDSGARKAMEQRRQELSEKQKQGKATKGEKKELEDLERKLKRLSRQKEPPRSKAEQTLSELDRQLAEAARELAEQQKKAGQFLDRAAKTVSQASKKALTDQEKRELLKQLKDLKERLRRQQEEGPSRQRMRDFQRRARGGQQPSSGEGKGKQGQRGQGQLQLGPDGIPIPGTGQPEAGQGAGREEGPGAGSSKDPGHGHNAQVEGKESHLQGAQTKDAVAVAQDTGQGQSASETIVTAAEEGFTQQSYQKLFREYETVAEEVMERENVPPGRKAHVQRYFELIRPRGDAPLPQKEK